MIGALFIGIAVGMAFLVVMFLVDSLVNDYKQVRQRTKDNRTYCDDLANDIKFYAERIRQLEMKVNKKEENEQVD